MKVLEISFFDPNGKDRAGVERYINKLKKQFESQGDKVTVVSITFNKYIKSSDIQIYVNPILRRLGLAKIIYNIKLLGSSDYSVDRFNTNIEIKLYGI